MADSQTSTFKMDEGKASNANRLRFIELVMQGIRDLEFSIDSKWILLTEFLRTLTRYIVLEQAVLATNYTAISMYSSFLEWRPKHFLLDENYLRVKLNFPVGNLPKFVITCHYRDKDVQYLVDELHTIRPKYVSKVVRKFIEVHSGTSTILQGEVDFSKAPSSPFSSRRNASSFDEQDRATDKVSCGEPASFGASIDNISLAPAGPSGAGGGSTAVACTTIAPTSPAGGVCELRFTSLSLSSQGTIYGPDDVTSCYIAVTTAPAQPGRTGKAGPDGGWRKPDADARRGRMGRRPAQAGRRSPAGPDHYRCGPAKPDWAGRTEAGASRATTCTIHSADDNVSGGEPRRRITERRAATRIGTATRSSHYRRTGLLVAGGDYALHAVRLHLDRTAGCVVDYSTTACPI